MEEKILNLLKEEAGALSALNIAKVLNISEKEVENALEDLLKKELIYQSKKKKYLLYGKGPITKGVLETNKKGFGFVRQEMGEDIYIAEANMGDALHHDLVACEKIKEEKVDGEVRLEGRILKVLKRGKTRLVGELKELDDTLVLVPDDERLKILVYLDEEDLKGEVPDNKLLVEVTSKIKDNAFKGKKLKDLGNKFDPGVDILSFIEEAGVPTEFSAETLEELKSIPDKVSENELKGRKDLSSLLTVTIDGDDTKDIDDAISILKEGDNYRLYVHIADVSHYVKEDTPLDKDAFIRGNSYYLVDRVIPMYPHQLSNGICSLNEGDLRLSMTMEALINKKAEILSYDIYPSYIISNKRMTYKNVNDYLERNVVNDGYEDFTEVLTYMDELSKILRNQKIKKGYIDFAIEEAYIKVDENCHPVEILKRERGRGENIIEDFMIIANEVVATHIYNMNLPFLYRVHEEPDSERVTDTLNFIRSLGHTVNVKMDKITPKTMQLLLESLKESPDYQVISKKVLRTMAKAKYMPVNLGHFGLASSCYTHFTAPIRRYSDTTVHRLLHDYLENQNYDQISIDKWVKRLDEIGEQTSHTEKVSIDLERDVEAMKMAEYMEDHIGEEYEGIISGLANFGIFVTLDNLVEGLVPIDTLPGFFEYNKERETLKSNKKTFKLGERIKVRVDSASKESSTIDFSVVGLKKDNGNSK